MPDPITVGGLVAVALAAGAAEIGKAALGQPARDAYDALKSAAARVLGPAVGGLEKEPDSDDLAAGVADEVAKQPDAVRAELAALAAALKAALAAEGRAGTIDNRITVIASGANSIAAGRDANLTLGKSWAAGRTRPEHRRHSTFMHMPAKTLSSSRPSTSARRLDRLPNRRATSPPRPWPS